MIHRYWRGGDGPPLPWLAQFLRATEGVPVKDWNDRSLPGEARSLADRTAFLVTEAWRPRHRANVLRWWLLLHEGGVWLDHDVIPLRPVHGLPRPWVASVRGKACSCAIGLDPGDPLAEAMLGRVEMLAAEEPRPGRGVNVSGDNALQDLADGVPIVELYVDSAGNPVNERSPLLHLWVSSST